MSNVVDHRVVEMEFDNSRFQSNVKDTMSSLDKLKASLSFAGVQTGFEQVEKKTKSFRDTTVGSFTDISNAANRVDLSILTDAVLNLERRFSALGIVGMRVIENITDSMIRLGRRMTAFVTSGIVSGGISRAMKIEQAKFQLEGLGVAWKQIFADIDYAVSGTAYGLDSAAVAASQLVASGVQFGETFGDTGNSPMAKALRGISGVAAMTNSTYDDIARIFATVAGNGRLMGEQLLQLGGRGLNAASTLAEALGKTETEIRDMTSKGKIDFNTFAEAMDNAFGQHAKDADKTFTGVMSNVRAALSRIGADFVQPLIDSNSKLILLLQSIKGKINDVRKITTPIAELFSKTVLTNADRLKKTVDAIDISRFADATKIFEGFVNVFNTFREISEIVKRSFREIFPEVTAERFSEIAQRIKEITENLRLSDSTAAGIKDTFTGVFSVIRNIYENLLNLVKLGTPIYSFIGALVRFFIALTGAIGRYAQEQQIVNKAFIIFSNVIKIVLIGVFALIAGIMKLADIGIKVVKTIQIIVLWLRDLIHGVFDQKWGHSFDGLVASLVAVKEQLIGVLGKPAEFIGRIFQSIYLYLNTVKGIIEEIGLFGIAIIGIALILARVFQLIYGPISSVLSLARKVSGFIGSITATAKAIRRASVIMALTNLAYALSVLSASLFLLTSVEPRKLIIATAAIGLLVYEIFSMMKYVATVAEKKAWIKNFGERVTELKSILYAFSFAAVLLSVAMRNMAKLDAVSMLASAAVLNASLWSMVGILVVLTNIAKNPLIDIGSIAKSSKAFLAMSLAMVFIAKAIESIGGMRLNGMLASVIALEIVLWSMVGVIFALSKISMFEGQNRFLIAAAETMVLMSLSLKIIADAFKTLKNISFGQALSSLIPLEVALWSMVGVIFALKKIGETTTDTKVLVKASSAMLVMSLALRITAGAFKALKSVSFGQALSALVPLEAALWSMVGVIFVLKKIGETTADTKVLMKASGAMLIMSIALRLIGKAISTLKDITFGNALASLAILEVALWSMVGVIFALKKIKETMYNANVLLEASAAILVMSIALKVIGKAILSLKDISFEEGIRAILPLQASLWSMVLIIKVLNDIGKESGSKANVLKASVAIFVMSLALKMISKALMTVSGMNWQQATTSFLMINGTLWSMFGVLALLVKISKYGAGDLLLAGAAFLAMSVSLRIAAKAIKSLSDFDWATNADGFLALMGSILGLAAVLAAFSAVATAFPVAIPAIGAIALAISMLGLTLLMAGAGLKLGAQALEIFAPALNIFASTIGPDTISKVADAFLKLAWPLTALGLAGIAFGVGSVGLGLGLMALGGGLNLIQSLDYEAITEGIKNLVLVFQDIATLGDLMKISAVGFIAGGIGMLSMGAGLAVFSTGLAYFSEALSKFLEVDISGLSGMLPEIVKGFEGIVMQSFKFLIAAPGLLAGAAGISAFAASLNLIAILDAALVVANIELLNTHILALAASGVALGLSAPLLTYYSIAMSQFADSIRNAAEAVLELNAAGPDAVQGFIEGTEKTIDSGGVGLLGQTIAKVFLNGFALVSGWHSPWKTLMRAGQDAYLGLKAGVESTESKAEQTGNVFANSFIEGLRNTWGWHSPWTTIVKAVKDALKAIVNTTKDTSGDVEGAGASWAESFLKGFNLDDISAKIEGALSNILSTFDSGGLTGVLEQLTNALNGASDGLNGLSGSGSILDDIRKSFEELQSSTDSMDDLTSSTNNATEAYEKMGSSASKTKTFVEKLTDTIKNQLDIFSQFNAKTEITGEQMLNNMASQVSGVRQWAENLQYLSERGIDDGLLQHLTELGPAGYEKVAAFVNMTDEQLQMAGQLFQDSMKIPESTAAEVSRSWWKTGEEASEDFTNAVASTQSKEKASEAGKEVAEAAVEAAKEETKEMEKVGQTAGENVKKGLRKTNKEINAEGADLGNGIVLSMDKAANSTQTTTTASSWATPSGAKSTKEVGKNAGKGLADGMHSEIPFVRFIARSAAFSIMSTLAGVLKIHSPSRETFKMGEMVMLGLALGMRRASEIVKRETKDEANNLMTSFSDILDPDIFSFSPTIRPVLDLSSFNQGYSSFSRLMDADYSKNLSGSINTRTSFDTAFLDAIEDLGDNSDVVEEVRSLKGTMADMTSQISKMQVVLDSNVLVGEMVTPLDNALGSRAARSRRER